MKNPETVERAYSGIISCRGREIMLNVRILSPPWNRNKNDWMDVNQNWHHPIFFSRRKGHNFRTLGNFY